MNEGKFNMMHIRCWVIFKICHQAQRGNSFTSVCKGRQRLNYQNLNWGKLNPKHRYIKKNIKFNLGKHEDRQAGGTTTHRGRQKTKYTKNNKGQEENTAGTNQIPREREEVKLNTLNTGQDPIKIKQ